MKKNNMRKMMSLGLVGAMTLSMTAVSFADTATPELINIDEEAILANTASAEIMTGKLVGISQPNNMDPMYKVVNDQNEVLFTVTKDTVLGEDVSIGDEVIVSFDGIMTMSIPALATADSIVKVPGSDEEVPVQLPEINDEDAIPVQLPEINDEDAIPVQLPEINDEDAIPVQLPAIDIEESIPAELPEIELPIYIPEIDDETAIETPEVDVPEIELPIIDVEMPEIELPIYIPEVDVEDGSAVESPADLEDQYEAIFKGTIVNVDLVDGEGRILVQTEEGMEVIFNINADTESDIELSELEEGDNVVIGFNGIMTMSLPGISNAQFITVVESDVDAQ